MTLRMLDDLPKDLDEQFEFALLTLRNAYKQKIGLLETETTQLRDQLNERESQIGELDRRIARAEQELHQLDETNQKLMAENGRLETENAENNNLIRKMKRDLFKLQAFKKAIIETFSEDDLRDEDDYHQERGNGMTSGVRQTSRNIYSDHGDGVGGSSSFYLNQQGVVGGEYGSLPRSPHVSSNRTPKTAARGSSYTPQRKSNQQR